MVVKSPTEGWDGEVYAAASGPPGRSRGMGRACRREANDSGTTEEIALTVRQPSRYFLLWIVKSSEARDQAGRYQVEISDIALLD